MENNKNVGEGFAIVTLDQIVDGYLARSRDYNESDYDYILNIAKDGLIYLNIFHIQGLNVVHLRFDDKKTLPWPSDMVDYSKIGISINGRLWNLSVDESLLESNESCQCPCDITEVGSVSETEITSGFYYAPHYYQGKYYPRLFGLGGGWNENYVKIDRKNRKFIFEDKVLNGEIVLEYKSTGIKTNGQTLVPAQAFEVLRQYIHYSVGEFDDKVSIGEKNRRNQVLTAAKSELQVFENMFTVDEYLDMCYESNHGSIKR